MPSAFDDQPDVVTTREIDRSGEIPDEVFSGLARVGAFGIKIPAEYGGLGLSPLAYVRAMAMVPAVPTSTSAMARQACHATPIAAIASAAATISPSLLIICDIGPWVAACEQ